MTRGDKHQRKPRGNKYRQFKEDLASCLMAARAEFDLKVPYFLHFRIATKDRSRFGNPHFMTPDKDNLEKAFLDALHNNDSAAWHGLVVKTWSETDAIEVWRLVDWGLVDA